jgi:glycosyltransferase involved in cell wall biosynthesis
MNTESDITVTIGIPTYNRADGFLKQAIQCALDQSYENVEVVISDNCSTDNTEALVKGFPDKRIRYFRQSHNIGPYKNFNFCLEQAMGDYFLMLHDDDMIDRDFVEACIEKAGYSKDIGVIRTGTRLVDGKGIIKAEFPNLAQGSSMEDFCKSWFAGKTVLYFCSTLFNTEGLRRIGGFHSRKNLFQDAVAVVKLASQYPIVNVEGIKASFRKHSGEITFSVRVSDWCDDSLQVIELTQELATRDKVFLLDESMRFFSRLNYRRAMAVKDRIKRVWTYLIVWQKFQYKYPPPPLKRLLGKREMLIANR